MKVILVFDDLPEEENQIVQGLQRECDSAVTVEAFGHNTRENKGESYEQYIASWISKSFDPGQVALITCDKELGRYPHFPGLSAAPVSAVARRLGIPFCQYSRRAEESAQEFARYKGLRQWDSDEITLEGPDVTDWVKQIAALFRGFEAIRARYAATVDRRTPAASLAAILGHPESESRIALYGSGEQGFLKEILTFYDPQEPDLEGLQRRMPRVLGSWLYLSILRFPGILANAKAAASYLNIAVEQFERRDVQTLFESAKYAGPFAELGPWWWRAHLDRLIEQAGCTDGRAMAESHGIHLDECLDPQTKRRAGFYCMLTREPVSADNSRSGISWFPSGADLARIQKDKFDQITALVGMY